MTLPKLNVVHRGDVLEVLRSWPDEFVQVAVTSPPYWGLRVYGTPPVVWGGDAGCGHEWGKENWVFAEEVNAGATSQRKGRSHQQGHVKVLGSNRNFVDREGRGSNNPAIVSESAFCSKCGAWRGHHGLEPTIDLYVEHVVMWAREVRRVLRDDGTFWLNEGDCYASSAYGSGGGWATDPDRYPNAPTQRLQPLGKLDHGLKVKDLCMVPARVALALQADGWWLRCDIVWAKPNPMPESVTDRPTKAHEYVFLLTKSAKYFYDADAVREPHTTVEGQDWMRFGRGGRKHLEMASQAPTNRSADCIQSKLAGENVQPEGRSHFRTGNMRADGTHFNPAGRNLRSVWRIATQPYPGAHFATFPEKLVEPCILAGSASGDIVLDPFAGTGTVGVVALKHGRDFIGIDLAGGDKDYGKGPGGVQHHTANERLAAAKSGQSLVDYRAGQGRLFGERVAFGPTVDSARSEDV